MKGTLGERFWAKVDKRGPKDCWEWQGAQNWQGYGYIREDSYHGHGEQLTAHRVSWGLAYGSIPDGMCVLHHCDNPACVNPKHLFLGTMAANRQDMVQKGREKHARGERQGSAKLTEENVHKIREMLNQDIPQRVIGERYAVTGSTISLINTGKCWGWLL